jgi:hypothetical protein
MQEVNRKREHITYIGYTNWRNKHLHFGIKEDDRYQGIHILGRTGMGKSTLLLKMALQDIEAGRGIAVQDPHGDLATAIMQQIPEHRKHDVIYFNAADPLLGFNPLQVHEKESIHLQASEVVSSMKKVWDSSWGYRLEYHLRFAILTLLHYPGATLLDIQPLLLDKEYRSSVLAHVEDNVINAFWQNEYDRMSPSLRHEVISSILNKSGAFLADNTLKRIFEHANGISMREVIEKGKVLIINLSKGLIGDQACTLLGSLITSSIQMAIMNRARLAMEDRQGFYYYIDEVHNYISSAFAQLLSECRKFRLGLIMAHQYVDQLPEDMRNAIFGNIGTMITFRLGTKDAKLFEQEFYPVFSMSDFINLGRFEFYTRLMIDGIASKAFSASIH